MGYVYVIGTSVAFKVGFSTNPVARLEKLATDSPLNAQLILAVPGTCAMERAVHRVLSVYRVHGEWFACEFGVVLSGIRYVLEHSRLPRRGPAGSAVAGETLSDWLERRGVTVTDLADAAGLSRVYTSNVVNGHKKPSVDAARRLSTATRGEVKPSTILGVE